MRFTGVRPQLRAMSVAFDDQGETVPTRGTTRKMLLPASSSSAAPPSSSSAGSVRLEPSLELDEIAVFGAQRAQIRVDLLQRGEQLGESELRQGARPAKLKDFGD